MVDDEEVGEHDGDEGEQAPYRPNDPSQAYRHFDSDGYDEFGYSEDYDSSKPK